MSKLSDFVANLCLNGDYSDVTFCVEGERYPAHRLILASREYFRALLFGKFAENQQKEIVLNVPAAPFKALLKYIYNDCKIVLRDMNLDEIIGILRLAHEYDFEDLTIAIEYHLKKGISMETVCMILKESQGLSLDSLIEACLKFRDANASKFLLHDNFAALSKDSLCALLMRDTFAAPEVQIFEAVQDWSTKNCVAEADLEAVIALVRLPLMSVDQLSRIGLSGLVRPDLLFKTIASKKSSIALHTSINVASSDLGAKVIVGFKREELLNDNTTIYGDENVYTYHKYKAKKKEGITVDLGSTRFINHIRLLLWDYSKTYCIKYLVEVSTDQVLWERVVDHTQHFCRSWQHLYFPSMELRYIRFFGTETNGGSYASYAVVSLKGYQMPIAPFVYNGFVMPTDNVATADHGACVLLGKNGEGLLYSSTNPTVAVSERNGYTSHPFNEGDIVVQLGQPCYIGSIRLLLRNTESRTYRFYVQTSVDKIDWTMAVDMRNKDLSSSSETDFTFTQRLVLYIKIIGTECSNKDDKEFCCARFECPATPVVASMAIERKCPTVEGENIAIDQ